MARLLLVDDDPDQVEIRKLILEKAGHTVAAAQNAESALVSFDGFQPEVVVMDLRLPRTDDGLNLIRGLRTRDAHVRIIVLTGWPADFWTLPESNLVDQFLRKPVRSQQLLSLIDRVA